MTGDDAEADWHTAFSDDESVRSRAKGFVFGDRIGLALFLAAVVLFTAYWIADWRINDSLTLLNALHGMSEGHLDIRGVKYGTLLETPGTHLVGDRTYGRNYGMLTPALIPLAIVRTLAVIADLRIAFAGLWSLVVLALVLVVGRVIDRRRVAASIGSALALALFVLNVAVATPLDPMRGELYALQFVHLIAGAFVVVFTYRLLAAVQERRTAILAAAMVALATPLGLWATIPKRHVVTAAVMLAVGYALYRSRTAAENEGENSVLPRATAYALVGFLAWVHAPEALLLVVVLAAVDVPTARRNDWRALLVVGAVFALSLVPMVMTNYLISGSPVKPPRMLSKSGPSTGGPSFDGGGGSGGAGGSDGGVVSEIVSALDTALFPLTTLFDLFGDSVRNFLGHPDEIATVFLRSGYVDSIAEEAHQESVNLAVLESAPLLAALAGAVPAMRAGLRRRGLSSVWPLSPERVVDAYMILFAVCFSLLYLSRLPIHAQITVRYLFPLFPVLSYLVFRLPAVRAVVRTQFSTFAWTYAVAVLVGGQLLVVPLAFVNPGLGEAFQFHAVVGLVTAGALAGWAVVGRSNGWYGRIGAVTIGLAAAAGTVFMLLVTLDYFTVGNAHLLPIVRAVAEIVSLI